MRAAAQMGIAESSDKDQAATANQPSNTSGENREGGAAARRMAACRCLHALLAHAGEQHLARGFVGTNVFRHNALSHTRGGNSTKRYSREQAREQHMISSRCGLNILPHDGFAQRFSLMVVMLR